MLTYLLWHVLSALGNSLQIMWCGLNMGWGVGGIAARSTVYTHGYKAWRSARTAHKENKFRFRTQKLDHVAEGSPLGASTVNGRIWDHTTSSTA